MLSNATPPVPPVATSASPSSAPIHGICPVAATTYVDLFATGIDDRALLRFVRVLAAADAKTRAAAVAAARLPLDAATTKAVGAAITAVPCSDAIVANAQARMAAAISLVWGLSNDADANRMSDRIGIVAAAIAARHTLDATLVDGLVAPFGTSLAMLDAPVPAAPAGAACAAPDADAKTVRVTEPSYPGIARVAQTAGMVRIKVQIDSDGDVVSAIVYNDDLGGRTGASALRESAVLSAATSVYVPETKGCAAVAGAYLFRADFRRRP
jgi:outer membrane biosynthesis protein TonB